MRTKSSVAFFFAILFCVTGFNQNTSFRVIKAYPVNGSGGWDYIAVNKQKLYVSHGSQVNILDENSGDSIGIIRGTNGVHGIAFYNKLNKGYTSNGSLNNVFVFDLNTNKVVKKIATGENPDAIFFDDFSNKIITCNGRSKSLSIIDPINDELVASVDLGGKPEESVSDGKGKIFVNLEDKNEIAVVDLSTFSVVHKWSILPGMAATGLAIDRKTNRLFAGCDNKMLLIMNAENGKVVTSLPIGEGCDGVVFDVKRNLVFSSNGEGNISVIKEVNENKFSIVQTVPTQKTARTITLDPETGSLYLPAANIAAAEPGAVANARRKIVPGSFKVLVVK